MSRVNLLFLAIIGLVILVAIVDLAIWRGYLNKTNKEISESVEKNIVSKYRLDLSTPYALSIFSTDSTKQPIDSIQLVQLKKKLKNLIDSINTDHNQNILDYSNLNPVLLFPEVTTADKYELSAEQLQNIQAYIVHLEKEFDESIDRTNSDIDHHMNVFGIYLSVLIVLFGLLGIGVPVYLNISNTRDLEQARRDSQDALKKSEDARKGANQFTKAFPILKAQIHLSRLSMAEVRSTAARKGYLKTTFEKIKRSFEECNNMGIKLNSEEDDLYNDYVQELILKLDPIRYYLLGGNRDLHKLFHALIESLRQLINDESDVSYKKVDRALDDLINALTSAKESMT